MSKRNLRYASTLAQAIAILYEYRWTWFARWTIKQVAKRLIAKGIT